MTLLGARVVVGIDGPHLEAFEPLLDALEPHAATILLGPGLLLGVGPSLALYLRQCGLRPVLDTAVVANDASLAAIGRVVNRVSAAGVVVDARCGASAIEALALAVGDGVAVVVRGGALASDVDACLALRGAGASAILVGVGEQRAAGVAAFRSAGGQVVLELGGDGAAGAPADIARFAQVDAIVDWSIARADEPAAALAAVEAALVAALAAAAGR